MESPLELRLALPAEAPLIAAMSRDRIEAGLGWSWTTPRVVRSLADPATNVVVARRDDRLLGFGIMQFADEDAHLLLLAVRSDAVRGGVGTALMRWLERCAVVAGVGSALLEARQTNRAARAFYAGLGYREVRTVPGYYQGREACVRLVKTLRRAPVAPSG